MKNLRLFKGVLVACMFLLFNSVMSQDVITMMRGPVLKVKVLSEDTMTIKYKFMDDTGKPEGDIRTIETYRVFSLTMEGKPEKIYYEQDTTRRLYWTKEEMRMLIFGEQDARANHNSFRGAIGGFLFCGGASVPLGGSILSLSTIAVPVVVSAILQPKVRKKNMRDPKFLKEMPYIEGYQKIAKLKNTQRTLLASFLGVGVTMTIFAFFIN